MANTARVYAYYPADPGFVSLSHVDGLGRATTTPLGVGVVFDGLVLGLYQYHADVPTVDIGHVHGQFNSPNADPQAFTLSSPAADLPAGGRGLPHFSSSV